MALASRPSQAPNTHTHTHTQHTRLLALRPAPWHAPQDEDEDDDEDGYASTPVVFAVTVSKGDTSLGFKCVAGDDVVRVTHVELDDSGEGDQFVPYTGPVFDELDETLQQAFVDYLDERGAPGGCGGGVGRVRWG